MHTRTLRALLPVVAGLVALSLAAVPAPAAPAGAAAPVTGPLVSGCDDEYLDWNDDGSSDEVGLPFSLRVGSQWYDSLWVNNNGNVTLDEPMSSYTPFGLAGTDRAIIAPFFADVDTRGDFSDAVSYGTTTYEGRPALCVNWVDVGYYNRHDDKLNSFQLVLVDRSSSGDGAFDIVFNYGDLLWETGDASDGEDGFGGTSAAVGFSNGVETYFEMPGTLTPGSFVDGGSAPLTSRSNTGVTGRWVWKMRAGVSATNYVALGDSFQSGEGAYQYESGTDTSSNHCHRSARAYPVLLAQRGIVDAELKFRACSGAVVDDISVSRQGDGAAQTASLNRATRLVTIGVTGNDLHFGDVMQACVINGVLTNASPAAWLLSRCETYKGGSVASDLQSLRAGSLGDRLRALYSTIRTKAPNAKVVVVTYPQFFDMPTSGWGVFGQLAGKCHNVHGSDQYWVNEKIAEANQVLTRIARSHQFRVVDLTGAFSLTGHGLCTDAPAMNGVLWRGLGAHSESFHPNALGQSLMYDDIQTVVRSALRTGAQDRRSPGTLRPGVPAGAAGGPTGQPLPSVDEFIETSIAPDQVWSRQLDVTGPRLSVGVQWLDGTMRLELVSPSGTTHSVATPSGALVEAGAGSTRISVDAPAAGLWTLRVVGEEVLSDAEPVTISAYAEPTVLPPPVPRGTATLTGQQVLFDAQASTDPGGEDLTYLWDFGDGTTGSGVTVAHSYQPGAYVPSLVVVNESGRSDVQTLRVVVDQPISGSDTLSLVPVNAAGVTQAARPPKVRSLAVRGPERARTRVVRWRPPATDGGLSLTSYVVTVTRKGAARPMLTLRLPMTQTSVKLTRKRLGLGKRVVTVRAVNGLGSGRVTTVRFDVRR